MERNWINDIVGYYGFAEIPQLLKIKIDMYFGIYQVLFSSLSLN